MHGTLFCQNEDLADAEEDTWRRAGVHPVPKLKVSGANPDSIKYSIYFPDHESDAKFMREELE